MKKTREETITGLEDKFYDVTALSYMCPICGKNIRFVVHPLLGEAWSRGCVRGEHLRSHGIDHRFISPERKDDPVFIREFFQWKKKKHLHTQNFNE